MLNGQFVYYLHPHAGDEERKDRKTKEAPLKPQKKEKMIGWIGRKKEAPSNPL